MKNICFIGLTLILSAGLTSAVAAKTTLTHGYVKKTGIYVAPHFKSSPDSTRINNYSTKGNVNPFTGKRGTKPLAPGSHGG